MPRTDPGPRPVPAGPSRRRLLAGSAAVVATGLIQTGLAGCTGAASPTPDRLRPTSTPPGGTTAPATPSTPVLPGAAAAARSELSLAAAITRLGRRSDGDRRAMLRRIAAGHIEHAEVLLGPDPPQRVRSTAPRPSASPAAATTKRLLAEYRRTAAEHRRRALATDGSVCLLWASLAVANAGYAAALDSSEVVAVRPAGSPLPPQAAATPVDALGGLLRGVDAAVYAHQVALGRLSGRPARVARTRLAELHALRDALATRLRRAGAAVPAPEAAYELPGRVADSAAGVRLLRTVETALLPHCGRWLAAAAGADRPEAYATLAATAETARNLRAALEPWPGWP